MLGNWGLQRGGEGAGRSKELMLGLRSGSHLPATCTGELSLQVLGLPQPLTYTPQGLAGGPTQGRPPRRTRPPVLRQPPANPGECSCRPHQVPLMTLGPPCERPFPLACLRPPLCSVCMPLAPSALSSSLLLTSPHTPLPPPLCAAALCPAWFLPFLLPHSLSLLTSRCLSLSLFLLLFSVGGSTSPRWCSRSLSLASGSAPSRSGPPSLPHAPSASLSGPSVLSSFPLSPSFSASHPDWLGLFIKGPHFLVF